MCMVHMQGNLSIGPVIGQQQQQQQYLTPGSRPIRGMRDHLDFRNLNQDYRQGQQEKPNSFAVQQTSYNNVSADRRWAGLTQLFSAANHDPYISAKLYRNAACKQVL